MAAAGHGGRWAWRRLSMTAAGHITNVAAMTAPDQPSGTAEADSRRDAGRPSSVRPIPLTGAQHDIRAGEYEATVTELGAGLRRLSCRGKSLITAYEPDELPPGGAG